MSMTLYIDNRAGSKQFAHLAPLKSISELSDFENEGSFPGDAYFIGNGPSNPITCGVEIKTLSDFISSVRSGRLYGIGGQIPRMLDTYDRVYLLVYGAHRVNARGAIEYWYVPKRGRNRGKGRWRVYSHGDANYTYRSRCSISIETHELNAAVDFVQDIDCAAQWLASCYHWWQKQYAQHKLTHTFNWSANDSRLAGRSRLLATPDDLSDDPKLLLRARMIAQCEGIRFEKARAIAALFSSPAEMFTAVEHMPELLQRARGIGKKLASRLNEQCSEYS